MLNTTRASNQDFTKVSGRTAAFFFAPLFLLVCLLAIYWPGFSGDWYLDDFGNIHENPNIHLASLTADEITKSFYGLDQTHRRFNRPLSYFSLALNYYFGGTNPFGYHVVNFLVHYTTAAFLFLLTLNILKLPLFNGKYDKAAYAIALLSSFLWATHPIQVNAVTYIVQRMSALAGLFTVLSLYCYVKARKKQQPADHGHFPYSWYLTCTIAGACAVASKQNAAMLPFSILLLEILLIRRAPHSRQTNQMLKILIPPVVIFLLIIVFLGGLSVFQANYGSRPFTMADRLLTEPRVIFFYIGQLLNPSGATFALLHDFQVSTSVFSTWTTLPAILLIIAIIVMCLLFSKKWPLFSFCYLFFFLNHAVEGSFIPLELIFEHRNYLPSLFFFLLPTIGFFKVVEYFSYSPFLRILAVFGLAIWILGQAHTTYMQNALFGNQVFFWTLNVRAYPDLHRPRHNLAKAMFLAGLDNEAERQMHLSLEGKSAARQSQKFATVYNLGVFYFYKMEYQRAMKLFSMFLRSSPNHINALKNIAELYMQLGETDKALQAIDKALARAPDNSSLHIIKGYILLARKDVDGAFAEADLASGLNHNKIGVGYIKAEGYRLEKEYDKAIKQFNRIAAQDHGHYAALLSLIELYYLTGRQNLLAQTIGELNRNIDSHLKSQMLVIYDRRWNFAGPERMRTIKRILNAP